MSKAGRVVAPLGIIAVGIAALVFMVKTKPEPKKKPKEDLGALVELLPVEISDAPVNVSAKGTVVPARELMLNPEVTGRVRWVSPKLVPGGRIPVGETLVRLDARDLEISLEQQRAALDRAQTDLELEHGRKKVAKAEWKLFAKERQKLPEIDEEKSLALRGPQMRTAKVAVKAAESGVEKARRAVNKTRLVAPFNAMVREERVEVGQLVGPNTVLATLIGTDSYWVQVSIPVSQLARIRLPDGSGKGGAVATVHQTIGGERLTWKGHVIRVLGDVDKVGRMARLIVEIPDPLGLSRPAEERPRLPLLVGSYAEIMIAGGKAENVAVIPRSALRDGDRVYVMKDGVLDIRNVDIAYRGIASVYVSKGISAGEQLVTSPLPAAVPGRKLRAVEALDSKPAPKTEAAANPTKAKGADSKSTPAPTQETPK